MAHEHPASDLSLVPRSSEHTEVIRRHGSSVVLYDHRSQQISLAHTDDVGPTVCPTCQRPFDSANNDASYISPDYFKILHRSNDPSAASSRSVSPRRLTRTDGSSLLYDSTSASEEQAKDKTDGSAGHIDHDAFSQGYFDRFYVELKVLGRGGSGVVLLVKQKLGGHDLGNFALKRIPVGDDTAWLQKVLREVQLLSSLTHPNLVSYRHVWLEHFQPTAFTPRVPHAFILQQYCNRGDLQSYIFSSALDNEPAPAKRQARWRMLGRKSADSITHVRKLQPEEVFGFFKDIASGLHYLHSQGYIHRDLKPNNCLLDDSSGKLHCLVSDFGETTSESIQRGSTGATGTLSYCAPEVLRSDPLTGRLGDFTMKSDIFSLGLILYLMCFGRLPYSNANPFDESTEDIEKLREEIATWAGVPTDSQSHSNLPTVLSESLGRLLSLNPADRPNSGEVLQGLKNFGTRTRGRTNSDAEQDAWFLHTTDNGSRPNAGSSPLRRLRPLSSDRRSVSTYKAPAVENDEIRSPPVSPVDNDTRRFPFPPPAETSLVRRRPSKEPPTLPSPIQSPLLLPPPRPKAARRVNHLIRNPFLSTAVKLLIFIVKAWTLLSPCQPQAVEPYTAYPLLLLAASDLSSTYSRSWTSIVLAVAHVGALVVVSRHGRMCQNDTRGMG